MVAFSILFIAINGYVLVTRGQAQSNETSNCAFYRCVGCAFVLFPVGWVVSSLVLWGALVWPGVARVNRQFQNISDAEPPLRS